jgi:glycosyltransferase involved in cell wall biosynthesis
MIIVINTNSFSSAYHSFITTTFIHLAKAQPQAKFILLSTQKIAEALPTNCTIEIIKQLAKNKLAKQYYYNYKLPSFLKKIKATHYFAGNGIISSYTKINQYCFLSLPINNKVILPENVAKYYGSKAKKKLAVATKIITTSTFEKNKIENYLKLNTEKFETLPLSVPANFTPLFWENQQQVKVEYSKGLDFFLANYTTLSTTEFTTLLKAYTQFKQWQKSSLQLLIYLPTLSIEIEDLYNNYKYKEEVKFIKHINTIEYPKLLASAYAFIFCSTQSYLPLPVLEAMHSQVPVICDSKLKETFGENVTYATFTDIKSISNQLILLYKDEAVRNSLINNAFNFTSSLGLQATTDRLWQTLN